MSIINKLFNIVYIISYKGSTRLPYLEEHLNELSINYKIIYGPKYDKVSLENLLENNKLTYTFYNNHNNVYIQKIVANVLTHIKAWNDFIESKYDKCMIIEDDNIFIKNYEKYIIESKLPTNYDYIAYGWENYVFTQGGSKDERYNDHYDKLYWGRSGAHCYVISKKTARKLIEYAYPIYKAPDGYIGDMCYVNKNYNEKTLKGCSIAPKEKRIHFAYISIKKIGFGISNLNSITDELDINSDIKQIFKDNSVQMAI